MKIGSSNNGKLSPRQTRVVLFLIGAGVVVVLASMYMHFAYRDVRALVVGNTIDLASRADGRVTRILVGVNEPYEAGQSLVELTNPTLRAEHALLEREVTEGRRALSLESTGLGLERRLYDLETTFAEAKSKLAAARIGLESIDQMLPGLFQSYREAESRFHRGEELVHESAMSRSELEGLRRHLLSAERAYREGLSKRAVYESEIATFDSLLQLHHQRLDHLGDDRGRFASDLALTLAEKERDLSRLDDLVSELTIVASHPGIVTSVLSRPGEYVASGQPIMSVMTADDLWVEAYLPPSDKKLVRPGDRVYVQDPSGSARISGRVLNILPVLRPFPIEGGIGIKGNYAVVRITFDDSENAGRSLSPAQLVNAQIRRRWVPIANAEFGDESKAPDATPVAGEVPQTVPVETTDPSD